MHRVLLLWIGREGGGALDALNKDREGGRDAQGAFIMDREGGRDALDALNKDREGGAGCTGCFYYG